MTKSASSDAVNLIVLLLLALEFSLHFIPLMTVKSVQYVSCKIYIYVCKMQNEVLSDVMHTRGTKLIALNNSNGFQPYCPTPMI